MRHGRCAVYRRHERTRKEGTYVEATKAGGGILLRPIPANDRGGTCNQLLQVVEEARWIGEEPRPDPDQEEEQIYELIADFRSKNA